MCVCVGVGGISLLWRSQGRQHTGLWQKCAAYRSSFYPATLDLASPQPLPTPQPRTITELTSQGTRMVMTRGPGCGAPLVDMKSLLSWHQGFRLGFFFFLSHIQNNRGANLRRYTVNSKQVQERTEGGHQGTGG